MKLLILIPALNESEHITGVIKLIPKDIQGVSSTDILVIDDGSKDNTAQIAESLGAKVVKHYVNRGLGVVFDRGLQYAIDNKYDIMVTIDADGQFSPKDIPSLIAPIVKNEADFVTASRFINREFYPKMPLAKFLGNRGMAYLLSRLAGQNFHDVSCGFRAYSYETMLLLNLIGEFTYTHEVFLSLAFKKIRIFEIPVNVYYNLKRRSRIASNLWVYGINSLKLILRTYRDHRPLRFFLSASLLFFIIGVLFESVMFINFINKGTFRPHIWSGFVGGAFFFLSVILFTIGLLADMFTSIRKTQERIIYLLKEKSTIN